MPRYSFSRVHLFGGTPLIRRLATELSATYEVHVWTAPRQVAEAYPDFDNCSLDPGHSVDVCEDINAAFPLELAEDAIGIGIGEAWKFGAPIREAFGDRLIDFMSIPYPYYLGGAHLTHAMLLGEEHWGCCMQLVTENTVQGVCHDGAIIHQQDITITYTDTLTNLHLHRFMEDRSFFYLKHFIDQAAEGRHFDTYSQGFVRFPSTPALMYPRLNTKEQAWIDWSWTRDEIVRFIRAFDLPYPGARTHLLTNEGVRVVTVHTVHSQYPSASHPFHSGLITGKSGDAWLVSTRDGAILVDLFIDGAPYQGPPGVRLFTRRELLDDALMYQPDYTPMGDANASHVSR